MSSPYTTEEVWDAWDDILTAAESVLEDDLNEDGMPDAEYERRHELWFKILGNPGLYAIVLRGGEMG